MNYDDEEVKIFCILIIILIFFLFRGIDSVLIGQTPAPIDNQPNLIGTVFYSDGKTHSPSNWKMNLYFYNKSSWVQSKTNNNGGYLFNSLNPGIYKMFIYNTTGGLTYENNNFTIEDTPYNVTFDPVTS